VRIKAALVESTVDQIYSFSSELTATPAVKRPHRKSIMPVVFIPPSFRPLAAGQQTVDVEGSNVREVIDSLDARFPGFRERLIDGDSLRAGLSVVVGTRVGALGLLEKVAPHSEVHFLPSISGG